MLNRLKRNIIQFTNSDDSNFQNSFNSSVDSETYVYDDTRQFFDKVTHIKKLIKIHENENEFIKDNINYKQTQKKEDPILEDYIDNKKVTVNPYWTNIKEVIFKNVDLSTKKPTVTHLIRRINMFQKDALAPKIEDIFKFKKTQEVEKIMNIKPVKLKQKKDKKRSKSEKQVQRQINRRKNKKIKSNDIIYYSFEQNFRKKQRKRLKKLKKDKMLKGKSRRRAIHFNSMQSMADFIAQQSGRQFQKTKGASNKRQGMKQMLRQVHGEYNVKKSNLNKYYYEQWKRKNLLADQLVSDDSVETEIKKMNIKTELGKSVYTLLRDTIKQKNLKQKTKQSTEQIIIDLRQELRNAMIKNKEFPPESYLYKSKECIELNKLIPNFSHGLYQNNKQQKEKLFEDLNLDLSQDSDEVIEAFPQLNDITKGKIFNYWKLLKKRG